MSIEEKGLLSGEFFKQIIADKMLIYEKLIAWSDEQRLSFKQLVDDLNVQCDNSKTVGNKLESVVEFIIKNSYFFHLYKNVRTQTNEIDEVVAFSEEGKFALNEYNIPRNVIPISADIMICECKNYKDSVGVTYVGKFYSLMKVTGTHFGIIFTQNGLTGESSGFSDGYGLVKVLRMLEIAKEQDADFYILVFTIEDYKKMIDGESFFELVKAKKMELQFATNYEKFISDNTHESSDGVRRAIDSYKMQSCGYME